MLYHLYKSVNWFCIIFSIRVMLRVCRRLLNKYQILICCCTGDDKNYNKQSRYKLAIVVSVNEANVERSYVNGNRFFLIFGDTES